ncbi:MBL fold metallo-hydrolase [Nakamurella leprariae]|uniref:MBL fold metallo-hydrolase n=1 Tax=Nakamurella leprariae TaxID=2803911 RepID=A0A939BZY7_9ACTN|nr:MBL fold metallo-hydrolase [Nakamurella leprariae]MBM9468670.1 MBL fold metallo-hydrolase [Nakamurella leprariae]
MVNATTPEPDPTRPEFRITGQAQYDAWQRREQPGIEQLRDTVWSVPVPWAGSPIRYTFCYVVTAADGALVVDPGWDSDEGWALLVETLARAGRTPEQVSGIVITHFHPDHLAMVERLRDVSDAWVGLHPADQRVLGPWHRRTQGLDPEDARAAAEREEQWLVRSGVPADARRAMEMRQGPAGFRLPGPPFRDLVDGDELDTAAGPMQVLHTPGHTAGSITLLLPEVSLILTGDHILPRITASIDFGAEHAGDPLADHYASLRRCAELATGPLADVEVGPAHEYRFSGLAARCQALIDAHDERSAEILDAISRVGSRLWDVAAEISWSRGWDGLNPMNRRMALRETECHLVHLAAEGRIDELEERSA